MIKEYVPVVCMNTVMIHEWMTVVKGCTYSIDTRADGCSPRVHIQ